MRNESIFNDDDVSSSSLGTRSPRTGAASTLRRGFEKEGATLALAGGAGLKPLEAQKGIIATGSPLWEPSKRCVCSSLDIRGVNGCAVRLVRGR